MLKIMVTVNVDIQDMLINWQIGEVAGFEIMNSTVKKICLKFQDPLVGRNALLSDYFSQQNCFVQLQKCTFLQMKFVQKLVFIYTTFN